MSDSQVQYVCPRLPNTLGNGSIHTTFRGPVGYRKRSHKAAAMTASPRKTSFKMEETHLIPLPLLVPNSFATEGQVTV